MPILHRFIKPLPPRHCLLGLVILALAACGKSPPPQAGGKPITYWLDTLHDADPAKRKEAVIKLGNVGAADKRALPALIEALDDAQAEVRHAAVSALIKYGPGIEGAVPALEKMRDADDDPALRDLAKKALTHVKS